MHPDPPPAAVAPQPPTRGLGEPVGLDAAQLARAIGLGREQALAAGDWLVREGDVADAMFVVLAGSLQVVTHDAMGRELVLERVEAGAHLGEQSLLPGRSGRRSASVRAATAARVSVVPKAVFETLLQGDPALGARLASLGAAQLRADFSKLSSVAAQLDLSPSAIARLTLDDGALLFRQGDAADAMYLVRSGRVGIWQEQADGRRSRLSTVERGGCVGELALLKRQPRSATAIADGPVELAVIGRERFDEAIEREPGLRDQLQTLERVYELPRRGSVALHSGRLDDQPCITALYALDDGRRFAARRVAGDPRYAIERLPVAPGDAGATVVERLQWQDVAGARSRELALGADGALLGLVARGWFADAGALHAAVLDGERLTAADRVDFATRGSWPAVEADARAQRPGGLDTDAGPPADAVLCRCLRVTAGALRQCIAEGARSYDALQRATGCGSLCGGCAPTVVELLGIDHWVPADVVDEHDEAPGVRSFVLAPRVEGYPAAAVGQHIVVEGALRGVRVRRPYTVSSARRARGVVAITVKREPQGAFSPWLFDERPRGEPLRITRPQGHFVLDLDRGPVGLLVAGIGVTPALAAVRTVLDEGLDTPLLVHYSGRRRDTMAGVDELLAAADRAPNIALVVRETAHEGRLDASALQSLLARAPDAHWYLCGPEAFLRQAAHGLQAAGVPGERVHVETFTPSGAPPASTVRLDAQSVRALAPAEPGPVAHPDGPPWQRLLRRAVGAALRAWNGRAFDWRVGGWPLNPVRAAVRHWIGRPARLDPLPPYQMLALLSVLVEGPYLWQRRLYADGDRHTLPLARRAIDARAAGRPLPARTPDGNVYASSLLSRGDVRLPPPFGVETGWSRYADGRFAAVYLVRGRMAFAHLLGTADHADRGPLPYHYVQQICGARHGPPGCPAAGLIAAPVRDNPVWQEDRALVTGMLNFGRLDEIAPAMAGAIDEILAVVDTTLAADPDRLLDIDALMLATSYTVLLRVLLGPMDIRELLPLGEDMARSTWSLPDALMAMVMQGQQYSAESAKQLDEPRELIRRFVELVRRLARDGTSAGGAAPTPFVQRLLAEADRPDGGHDRLVPFLMPFMIAGHETTGHTMAFALNELARDDALQAQVLDELQRFRSSRGPAPLATRDYDERPVMHAFLAENLRLHSPIPGLSRTADADGTVPPDPETGIGSFDYPRGAVFLFSVLAAHHDPKRWPAPERLDIGRYLDGLDPSLSTVERGQAVRRAIRAREEAWDLLPFGAGPGRCVGQPFAHHETIMVLDAFLERYRVEFLDLDRPVPLSQLVVLAPQKGALRGRLRPRPRTSTV